MAKSGLSPMQQRFVDEYLISGNATEAAKAAGYSPRSAGSQGCQMLKIPKVSEAISAQRAARSARTCITQDMVVDELGKIGISLDASDVPDSALKYASKIRALELLGKHLGMFRERVQIEASDTSGVVLLSPVMDAIPPPDEEGDT